MIKVYELLRNGTRVEILNGKYAGEISEIRDMLGQRTYILINDLIVDRLDIEVIESETNERSQSKIKKGEK